MINKPFNNPFCDKTTAGEAQIAPRINLGYYAASEIAQAMLVLFGTEYIDIINVAKK